MMPTIHSPVKSWRGKQVVCEVCGVTVLPGHRYHWRQDYFGAPKDVRCCKHPFPDEAHAEPPVRWEPSFREVPQDEPPVRGDSDYMICAHDGIGQCVRAKFWRDDGDPRIEVECQSGYCKEGARMLRDMLSGYERDLWLMPHTARWLVAWNARDGRTGGGRAA